MLPKDFVEIEDEVAAQTPELFAGLDDDDGVPSLEIDWGDLDADPTGQGATDQDPSVASFGGDDQVLQRGGGGGSVLGRLVG